MKYYADEKIVMKDGTSVNQSIAYDNQLDAISACASSMSSALINTNVATICVEARDNLGGFYFTFTKDLTKLEA